jgi:hypothetical protein
VPITAVIQSFRDLARALDEKLARFFGSGA